MPDLIQKARKCLSLIKSNDIDKGFCVVSSSVKSEFNVDGGEFSLFRTLINHGLSVTVYNKGKKGAISVNKYDDASIEKAVADCIAASESATPDDAWDIASLTENKTFTEGVTEPDVDKLFDRTEELLNDIKRIHPTIIVEQMIVSHTKIDKVYANSNGVEYVTHAGEYGIDVMFSAHEGDKSSSFFSSGVYTVDLSTPFIKLGSIEEDLSNVEKQVHTGTLDGKFVGTVLLPPSSLSFVIGASLNLFCGDTNILSGTSIWKDKLGEKVTDERLTVSVSPLDGRIVCGERYTGEGYISENYDVIKDGVLNSFMLSQYVANKTGKTRAKNSSGAVIMKNGTTPLKAIIGKIKKGIIIGRFSGGEPGVNGEFSGVAKNSFYIENGEIKYALSETMISGNLTDMLNNLEDISVETVCDGNSVLPYASFGGITISGK